MRGSRRLASLVFTVAFAVVVQEGERWAQWVSWTTLLVGGLLTVPVIVALQATFRDVEPELAVVGLVLGVAGAIGPRSTVLSTSGYWPTHQPARVPTCPTPWTREGS